MSSTTIVAEWIDSIINAPCAQSSAALRLGACFGLVLDLIEPCGFPVDERRVREAVPIAQVIYLEPDLDRSAVNS